MSIHFLGSKQSLKDEIFRLVDHEVRDVEHKIIDLFSGTGIISATFKENGYKVISNDFLKFCTMFSKSILLLNQTPTFDGIIEKIPDCFTVENDNYKTVLNYLNSLEDKIGFIYENYSPASINNCDIERMYFTKQNSRKIDSIRLKISEWKRFLTEGEHALLLSNLLTATNDVSNIAGTYGCYMKYWKENALRLLKLEKMDIVNGLNPDNHKVYNVDAFELISDIEAPILYIDPPYTKRQYSAYYHVLETISLYDNPIISGKTGLRYWQDKSSDFCYKKKAKQSLESIVKKSKSQYIFLSYNSDGHITHDEILETFSKQGEVKYYEFPYRRYKSNNKKSREESLKERLYVFKRYTESV